jgi:hypothetical protein
MTDPVDSRLFLNQLLTDLARRLHGAIDFWTLVCVNPVAMDARAFIGEQSKILKALAADICAELARTQALPAARGASERIRRDCEAFEANFLLLADFRQHHSDEVRSAAEALKSLCTELIRTVANLGRTLGCPVSYLEQMGAERKAYYQRILDSLPDIFLSASPEPATPQALAGN